MENLTVAARRERADRYLFHGLHPHARFGTASDRYAGWIGQIYSEAHRPQVKSRRRKLGGATFEEQTVPVASVAEYFEHFDVLEIDFTFYRPLLDEARGTTNYFVLQQYADYAPSDARFYLKAPQAYFTPRLRLARGGRTTYVENPAFLDADAYLRDFHAPAQEILGDRLAGVLFEQEYQRKAEAPDPVENVVALDQFFQQLPGDTQAHIELRSPHLLVGPYFDWLQDRGIGFVFSHWTWLPPLRDQWHLCGGRFTAADSHAVVRLLTPLKMPYEKAYAMAHPFDRPIPEITGSRQTHEMVLDVTALIYQAEAQGATVNVITNNRAYGNAPELGRVIARRVLQEMEDGG